MTAQIPDTVEHLGKCFSIAGVDGDGLFNPKDQGLTPARMSTACWRGFICHYTVDGSELFLSSLEIGLGRSERLRIRYNRNPPQLLGVSPDGLVYDDDKIPLSSHPHFRNLHHGVEYTGGLLLAREFIQNLYVHMGFHPAWKYRVVRELVFEKGKLVSDADRSADVAEFRDSMANMPLKPGAASTRDDVTNWIAKCFTQNYRFLTEK